MGAWGCHDQQVLLERDPQGVPVVGRGENQQWMGIDCIARNVVDQVGLEQHPLASDVNRKEAETRSEDLVELMGVLLRIRGSQLGIASVVDRNDIWAEGKEQ